MELSQEEQPVMETVAAPAAAQEAARAPYAQDGDVHHKVVAPLGVLKKTEGADDSHGDQKKMRADNPAIVDYVCILKDCRRDWEEKVDEGTMGFEDLGTTDQKRIGIGMRLRIRSRGSRL
jgi:hypothetical protein